MGLQGRRSIAHCLGTSPINCSRRSYSLTVRALVATRPAVIVVRIKTKTVSVAVGLTVGAGAFPARALNQWKKPIDQPVDESNLPIFGFETYSLTVGTLIPTSTAIIVVGAQIETVPIAIGAAVANTGAVPALFDEKRSDQNDGRVPVSRNITLLTDLPDPHAFPQRPQLLMSELRVTQ